MLIYYIVALLAFLALVAALVIRYVSLTVDREFSNLAKAATDPEFRKNELAKVNAGLDRLPPLPENALPLPGPSRGAARVAPPLLLAVGIILLWGGLFALPSERRNWLVAGGLATGGAAAIMLATLRKRRLERYARLLRSRADLRRLDSDHRGAADDLGKLLDMTPWDDAAWAELAESREKLGDIDSALDALDKALRLDPDYADYYMEAVGLALRNGKLERAGEFLSAWEKNNRDPRPAIESRQACYRAALALAEGDERAAETYFRKASALDPEAVETAMDMDESLSGLVRMEGIR